MSKFEKGDERIHRTGRPPGAKNKNPLGVQKALLKLLEDNLDSLTEDLKKLPPDKRVDALLKLARHVTPAALNPERLTVEQLRQLLDYLKFNNKDENNEKIRDNEPDQEDA